MSRSDTVWFQAGRHGGVAAAVLAALIVSAVFAPRIHAEDGFELSGEVDGLYPGAQVTLEATVTNPHPFAIRVTDAGATVLDAGSACPASMLQVERAEPNVVIGAHSTGTVSLQVRMSRRAPDACQGATWPLRFTGVAEEVPTVQLPSTSVLDPRTMPGAAIFGAALIGLALLVARWARRTMTTGVR
jgi:hypothetical protein